MESALELRTLRTSRADDALRGWIVALCIDAHDEQDFANLFAYLPPEGLHVVAFLADRLVGHAVVTNRWLQVGSGPLLRTAYVDAVATAPDVQGRGVGTAVMSRLASAIEHFDIACLETDRVGFYERLGWEEWRGPLAGRSADGFVPTPEQRGVMILRLPRTPAIDVSDRLAIEAHSARIW